MFHSHPLFFFPSFAFPSTSLRFLPSILLNLSSLSSFDSSQPLFRRGMIRKRKHLFAISQPQTIKNNPPKPINNRNSLPAIAPPESPRNNLPPSRAKPIPRNPAPKGRFRRRKRCPAAYGFLRGQSRPALRFPIRFWENSVMSNRNPNLTRSPILL